MASEFRIYRANNNKNGAASKFNISVKKKDKYENVMVFLETAKQTGVDDKKNARFDWRSQANDNGQNVTMKLGEADIGQILDALISRDVECKLFHQNERGSTTLTLTPQDKGFNLTVTSKQGADAPIRIGHSVSFGEAAILRVLLEAAIRRIYDW